MLREVAGLQDYREGMATDAAVVAAIPANTAAEILSAARLKFLPRLLKHGPAVLLALLSSGDAAAPAQWKGALAADLAWLGIHSSVKFAADPEARVEEACAMAAAGHKRWAARVDEASESARMGRRNRTEARLGEEVVMRAICAAGMGRPAQAPAPAPPAADPPGIRCPDCARLLRGSRALGLHRYRAHGIRAEARCYVDGTACPVCVREFHTRTRLVAHLSKDGPRAARNRGETEGGGCLPQLRLLQAPLDPEQVGQLDGAEQERRRSAGRYDRLAHLPAHRLPGPVPPPPPEPEPPPPGEPPAQPHVNPLDDPEAAPMGEEEDDETDETMDGPPQDEPDEPMDGQRAAAGGVWQDQPAEHVPRVLGNLPAFILHLFAGRRRPGDVQAWLEHEDFRIQGRDVRMVSVDVAIDQHRGNLCDPDAIAQWIGHIASGLAVGAVGGPPCETWSQVRGIQGGPPVLRTAAAPWGVHGLRPKLLKQVRVATLLLQSFLLVFAALVRSGGMALLEHPAEPDNPGKCSIWRLPATRALQSHPAVQRLFVRQGPLGQPSAKPTHLLCLRLASLQRHLDAEADPAWRPSFVAVGRDATGAWRTAALKEYPPRMCRAIARAFRDSLELATAEGVGGEEAQGAAEELMRLVMPLEVGTVGPDFAAGAAEALPPGPVQWDRLAVAAGTEPVHLRAATTEEPLRRRKRRGNADRPA